LLELIFVLIKLQVYFCHMQQMVTCVVKLVKSRKRESESREVRKSEKESPKVGKSGSPEEYVEDRRLWKSGTRIWENR